MRQFGKIALLFVFVALIAMQGSSEYYYYDYYAVYMDRTNLEKSVSYTTERKELKNPGKIYYIPPYLFVNEKYKGVHVFDNTDPGHPVPIGFIIAPGCLDMAVKGDIDIIYLDNAVDMVTFDLTSKEVTDRKRGIFPELAPPSGSYRYDGDRAEDLIIVEWVKRYK
jgi:hypothetical protein